jgi:hypothetical protein
MLFTILLGFTDFFLPLMDHGNKDSFAENVTEMDSTEWKQSIHNDTYYISDIMDSPMAKLRMEEMDRNFESCINSHKDYVSLGIKKVNILMGDFYDGLKLFSRVWTFWPLLLNIFNLPNSLRGMFGVSHFMTTFFGHPGNETTLEGKLFGNNPVVQRLFQAFYNYELNLLYAGVPIVINGMFFFLQVHNIFRSVDTRGFEHLLNGQGANSNKGCLKCDSFGGIYDYFFSKVIYLFHYAK